MPYSDPTTMPDAWVYPCVASTRLGPERQVHMHRLISSWLPSPFSATLRCADKLFSHIVHTTARRRVVSCRVVSCRVVAVRWYTNLPSCAGVTWSECLFLFLTRQDSKNAARSIHVCVAADHGAVFRSQYVLTTAFPALSCAACSCLAENLP
jgi:hypothetical protein